MITARESSRRGKTMPMLEILEEARARGAVGRARDRWRRGTSSSPTAPASCPRSRSTPRRRTSSPTPPARPASRRASCTCRAASSSRSRARPATRPTSTRATSRCFASDMGWIMGPWTVVGVGALGGTVVYLEGAPDWPARPALAGGRAGAHHLARPLADARPRAASARRPDARPVVAAHVPDERRAVEPRAVPLALRERRPLARADHQLLGRHRDRRVLPLAGAVGADQGLLARRARARDGDGHRRRRRPLARRHAARSASSSAASRSPG